MRPFSLNTATLIAIVLVPALRNANLHADQQPLVQFDLPPTVPAIWTEDPNVVSITLHLSSMIETADAPPVSHWMVRCVPRDRSIQVVDYSPRTETAADISTPIQIKQSAEQSQSSGVSIDGAYAAMTSAHVGADQGKKRNNSVQFDRVAPMQAVTASGTIHRGNGVYFKLRWTATQILEGEKTFRIDMRVPPRWRSGLMDVSVVAMSNSTSVSPWESLGPWESLTSRDRDPKTIGRDQFIVAVYRSGDVEAAMLAKTVSDAEQKLRYLSKRHTRTTPSHSLPSILQTFATKLDLQAEPNNGLWVQRLLSGAADPHMDKQIRRMPMPVRVAVLDYVDRRDEFNSLQENAAQEKADRSVIAAKPAIK